MKLGSSDVSLVQSSNLSEIKPTNIEWIKNTSQQKLIKRRERGSRIGWSRKVRQVTSGNYTCEVCKIHPLCGNKNSKTYFWERQSNRELEILHPLIDFPNGCKSQRTVAVWSQKLWTPSLNLTWVTGTQIFEMSSAASCLHYQGVELADAEETWSSMLMCVVGSPGCSLTRCVVAFGPVVCFPKRILASV